MRRFRGESICDDDGGDDGGGSSTGRGVARESVNKMVVVRRVVMERGNSIFGGGECGGLLLGIERCGELRWR